jgi:dipeptidyl aminopeptidase/acylaminoacyl peptidase
MGDIYDTAGIVSSAGRRLQGAVIERATGTDAFSSGGDLYATAEDGTNLRRLTETSTTESTPAWSPDGSSVAFELSFWAPTADR